MSSAKLPPLRERPNEATDPIWYLAFPLYYGVMAAYGFFAVLFPIASVAAVNGFDRAQVFGGLIAGVGVAMLVGTLISIYHQKPHVEFVATLLFLVLMGVYIEALYHAVTNHEFGARPGSTFLPLLFSIFPIARVLVIVRSNRIPMLSKIARRLRLTRVAR